MEEALNLSSDRLLDDDAVAAVAAAADDDNDEHIINKQLEIRLQTLRNDSLFTAGAENEAKYLNEDQQRHVSE